MSTTEVNDTAEVFISPKDLAHLWGTDPKTVRRFLRANTDNRAGKGGRWEIAMEDAALLTAAWNAKAEGVKFVPKADAEGDAEVTDEVEELDDELELDDIDEL